jgi:E3 Ubiquitin ligase
LLGVLTVWLSNIAGNGDFMLPLMGIAGVLAGVYLFAQGFRMLRYKRLILDTPFSKIRSASMGLVEISGRPTGEYTLTAPVTGAPCYYYRVRVWQWSESAKEAKWKQVVNESLYIPFYLDDGTGRVLINPQGAEMDVHRDFVDEIPASIFNAKTLLPENVRNFLTIRGAIPYEKVKVEEQVVKPDYPLFVFGTLGENNAEDSWSAQPHSEISKGSPFSLRFNLRGDGVLGRAAESLMGQLPGLRVERVVPETGVTHSPVVVSDQVAANLKNKGIVLPGVVAQSEAARATQQQEEVRQSKVAISKGERGEPFTISSNSQKEVVRELSWKSTLYIWGGPIFALICVYYLLAFWS